MSHVTGHFFLFFSIFFLFSFFPAKWVELVGGGSVIKGVTLSSCNIICVIAVVECTVTVHPECVVCV